MSIYKQIVERFGTKRDANVNFHAVISIFLKSLSLVINFAIVPLTINFFGVENYGLYTALMVISGWFVFIDIGMSNSFRNKVAYYYASKDIYMTKTFVSTTYAIFGIIGIISFILFLLISPYINYSNLLGQIPEADFNIAEIFVILMFFTLFNFSNRLITIVLMATQKASIPVLLSLITNIIILLLLYFGKNIISPNLVNLLLIYFLPTTLVWVIASLIFFFNQYSDISPSFSYIKFGYFRELISKGSQFFILQVENLVIYTSTSFIILKLFSTTEVAVYAVAIRFFSMIQLIFGIVMNVYWSAITEAIAQKDFLWIKENIIKLNKIFLIFVPITLLMSIFSQDFFMLWLGDSLSVKPVISYACAFSAFLAAFNSIYEYSLNGAGKIGFLSLIGIFNLIIFFPLIYYFVYILGFGPEGIIFSIIVCQIITSVSAVVRTILFLKFNN